MDKIGDLIPNFNDDFLDSSLIPGCVIRMFTDRTNPPKVKIFVVVGKNERDLLAALLVNSDINFKAIRNQEVINRQVPIQKSNNNFLKHDSFVDCTDYFEYSLQSTILGLQKNKISLIGQVSPGDLEEILKVLSSSPMISPIKLRKIGLKK